MNPLINRLDGFGAIERKPLGFRLIDPRRALTYWAATRELAKDVTYTTFAHIELREMEKQLPRGSILTAFSAFCTTFGSTPAEYNQVFVYAEADDVQRVFKPTMREKRNLIVLSPDEHLRSLSKDGVAPLAQVYVDLWQLGTPGKRFVEELDRKLAATPTKALEGVASGLKAYGSTTSLPNAQPGRPERKRTR